MPRAEDIPALVAFLLPGFLTLAVLAGLRGPSKRTQIEWIAWSLLFSLVTFWALSLVRPSASPNNDPVFQFTLLVGGVVLGFVLAGLLRVPLIGGFLHRFGTMTEPKVWNGLFDVGDWVQLETQSGLTLYGSVAECTNDPNESDLELYLDNVHSQVDGEWTELPNTDGVYVPGGELRWVQKLSSRTGAIFAPKTDENRP